MYFKQLHHLTQTHRPSPFSSMLTYGANSRLWAVFVGAAAAAAGITAPFHGSVAPVPVSLRRPGGIHHRTGRTAGPQERYNCHLLLLHIVYRRARRLNQKKLLFTSQAKQRAPLGRGSSRPPLCSVISAKEGRGCEYGGWVWVWVWGAEEGLAGGAGAEGEHRLLAIIYQ